VVTVVVPVDVDVSVAVVACVVLVAPSSPEQPKLAANARPTGNLKPTTNTLFTQMIRMTNGEAMARCGST
jgi:hypothetical protein